jgi:hypothetical protein
MIDSVNIWIYIDKKREGEVSEIWNKNTEFEKKNICKNELKKADCT